LRSIIYIAAILLSCCLIACSADTGNEYVQYVKQGDSFYADGKYLEAADAWEKASTSDNVTLDLYKKLGALYFQLQNFSRAEFFYRKIIELEPDAHEAYRKIGEIGLINEDMQKAEMGYDAIGKTSRKDPLDCIFLGDFHMQKGELPAAEVLYRQALSIETNHNLGLIKLAINLLAQNKKEEADNHYATARELEPRQSETILLLADYCRRTGNPTAAEKYYFAIIGAEPDNPLPRIEMAELYLGISKKDEALDILKPVVTRNAMGRSIRKKMIGLLLSLLQLDDAERQINYLEKESRDDLEVFMFKGRLHLLGGKPILSISDYQSAIEFNPHYPPAHYWLGISYMLGGHERLGLKSLINALTIDSDFGDAELAIAAYYSKTKKFELALEHCRRIIEKEGGSFRGYLIAGNTYMLQKHYDDAIKMFQHAESIKPDSIAAKYFSAIAMELKGEYDKALEIYQAILKKNSHLIDVGRRFADLLIFMNMSDTAIDYFETCSRENPQNAFLSYILGKIYMTSGHKIEAINSFRKAIDIDPKIGQSYLRLHEIYENEGDVRKQEDVLLEAIQNIPGFSGASMRLGLLYRQANREMDAIRILEEAMKYNPEDPFLANNLATLYLENDGLSIKGFELAQYAFQKMPEYPAFADTIGWAYCKRGIYHTAIWYLNNALEQKAKKTAYPGNGADTFYVHSGYKEDKGLDIAIIQYHLGVALFKSGNYESAKEHLASALQNGVKGIQKTEAENLLEQVESGAVDSVQATTTE
jgi:tetratricopeptide (TPR) repeat protein